MKFALISVVLLAYFAVALSLKCYQCTDCGSSKGEEKTCESGLDKCLKIYSDASGKDATSRSCTNQFGCDLAKGVCDAAKKADKECEAPCCTTDLCNSGAAPSFSVLLVSLCSLLAVVPFFK